MIRVLVGVSVLLAGCLTFSDFQLARAMPEETLPGSAVSVPLPSAFPLSLSLDLSAYLDRYPGDVEVTLDSFSLAVTDAKQPAGDVDDFGFLYTLHVFATGTTLPRVEIAHAWQHGPEQVLGLGVDDVDLTPYAREATTVDAVGTGTVPLDDVSFDGRLVFTVHPL